MSPREQEVGRKQAVSVVATLSKEDNAHMKNDRFNTTIPDPVYIFL